MVYAGLGAICFTLVSKALPLWEGELRGGKGGTEWMEHEFRLLGKQGMWPQLPFPIAPVKRFADFLGTLPSRVHIACSRTLSRESVSLSFLDWELLQSRDRVLCRSLMCPLSTRHGAEALGTDL